MAHQEASIVVGMPLAEVERRLSDVPSWPQFLTAVAQAEKTGHHRYQLVIGSGKRQRTVSALVAGHPADHRFTWRALEGPRYEGEIRLQVVDERQTRVVVSAKADPAGFASGMAEMLGSSGTATLVDLYRLADQLGGQTTATESRG